MKNKPRLSTAQRDRIIDSLIANSIERIDIYYTGGTLAGDIASVKERQTETLLKLLRNRSDADLLRMTETDRQRMEQIREKQTDVDLQSIVQGCLANHRDNRASHVYVEPRAIGTLKVLD
jgi:hypothetical protein